MSKSLLRTLAPYALLAFVAILSFTPLLFFGMAFAGEEQIGLYYALAYFVEHALHTGTSLLWDGANFGGMPTNLYQFASTWNPILLGLYFFLPFMLAEHVGIVLGVIGGLWLSYWYGRRQGWQQASALSLALGYFLATTFGWLIVGTLSAYAFLAFPGILLALDYLEISQSTSRYVLALIGGSLAIGLGFLGGTAQIMFYTCGIAGLYALFLDWQNFSNARALYRNLRVTIGFVGMAAVGLLLSIPQWVPSALLINLTTRTGMYALQTADHPHATELITLFLPPYFQVPFFGGGSTSGFYIGALGLVCVFLCLLYYRTQKALLFAGAYALCAAFAFHLPGFSWINEHVPPLSHMSGNLRWLTAGAFPLAFLGAVGIEGLLQNPERFSLRARRFTAVACAVVALALALGSIALAVLVSHIEASLTLLQKLLEWYTHGRALQYPPEHYLVILTQTLSGTAAMFSLANPRFLFGVATWVVTAAFFTYLLYAPTRRTVASLVVTFTFATAIGVCALQWSDLVPGALYTKQPALVSFLSSRESSPDSYRILGFLVSDGLFNQVYDHYNGPPQELAAVGRETLVNDTNLYFGIEQMDGMKAFRTLRVDKLLGIVGNETQTQAFDESTATAKQVPLADKLKDFLQKLPLLSMMNVKYVYSPYQLATPALKLIDAIVLPVGGGNSASLYVYENDRVLPRAYFAGSERFFAGSDAPLLLSVATTTDFSKVTWIECGDCTADAGGPGSITADRYQNGDIELSTMSAVPQWLVLSESAMPGWRATIDGVPAPIYTANYLFQTVEVPAGNHHIAFVYHDVSIMYALKPHTQ
ncbi:MAG: YfhO family protein [Patescibacteria group bacterium]|nr:YfhO family protein [Patescibacteria group bacterium]